LPASAGPNLDSQLINVKKCSEGTIFFLVEKKKTHEIVSEKRDDEDEMP
jgi:hypothetical protein